MKQQRALAFFLPTKLVLKHMHYSVNVQNWYYCKRKLRILIDIREKCDLI